GGYGSTGYVGGYGSTGYVGGYGSTGYVGGYSYPSIGYNYYEYPSLNVPGVPAYSTSYGSYTYPSLNVPGVPAYSTSYGSYTYPSMAYASGYNYPSISPGVAYAGTIANVPTGPENALLLILSSGLALSVIIYLILFKIRFRKQTGKIKQKEIKPDTDIYEYQF
ncbi:MAG: hypothetical protein ABIJ19_01815, partial [Patescibacteria group bacterium]